MVTPEHVLRDLITEIDFDSQEYQELSHEPSLNEPLDEQTPKQELPKQTSLFDTEELPQGLHLQLEEWYRGRLKRTHHIYSLDGLYYTLNYSLNLPEHYEQELMANNYVTVPEYKATYYITSLGGK